MENFEFLISCELFKVFSNDGILKTHFSTDCGC